MSELQNTNWTTFLPKMTFSSSDSNLLMSSDFLGLHLTSIWLAWFQVWFMCSVTKENPINQASSRHRPKMSKSPVDLCHPFKIKELSLCKAKRRREKSDSIFGRRHRMFSCFCSYWLTKEKRCSVMTGGCCYSRGWRWNLVVSGRPPSLSAPEVVPALPP